MNQLKVHLKGDTGRLAATYLAIIFSLTIIFSGIIYSISSSQFDRPLPPRSNNGSSQLGNFNRDDLQDLFQERADQARAELLLSLLFLNIAVLIGGAFLSYFLARKTLEPIEAAMKAQEQFVSDASHELRTPLTALQVTNEVALRRKKLTLPDAKELISHNLAETIKLRGLSESLLGLARQDNADTAKTDVDLRQTVRNVTDTLSPTADAKNIMLAVDVPDITVSASQSAIEQLLKIFIDNAITYSDDGSTVAIACSDDGSVLTVTDQGPGIAPEHQAKIFDRFYRVDESRSSRNQSGNGLGLAIAKAIADRNGYRIGVKSEQGHGSAFMLHL